MRLRAFDPWPKLNHNQQQRLRAIAAGGPMGVPAGSDHAPATTLELQRMGMVSVTLGRAYSNQSGRDWIEAHPLTLEEVGVQQFRRVTRSAKMFVTPPQVDKIRLAVGDVAGHLPSRDQMSRCLVAGGLVVA